jgi:hypothetical protein
MIQYDLMSGSSTQNPDRVCTRVTLLIGMQGVFRTYINWGLFNDREAWTQLS